MDGSINSYTRVYFNMAYYLKGGDRRVRIFSAHNNWWATAEVSLPLPYQRSAKVFLIFCDKEWRQCITLKICIRSRRNAQNKGLN